MFLRIHIEALPCNCGISEMCWSFNDAEFYIRCQKCNTAIRVPKNQMKAGFEIKHKPVVDVPEPKPEPKPKQPSKFLEKVEGNVFQVNFKLNGVQPR